MRVTGNDQRGLTLIELLLAVMLMGLVSVVLSQTFAVGTDAYHRGRRALRGLGQVRVASHTFVESARSMFPKSGKIKLESSALGSKIDFIRQGRTGLEENGFVRATVRGKSSLSFRRQWPPSGDADKGGNEFPLVPEIAEWSVSFRLPDHRLTDRWPPQTSSDTVPRLIEFKLRHAVGGIFESAAYLRIDPEAFALASDTSSDT